jgi:hypothetical protein
MRLNRAAGGGGRRNSRYMPEVSESGVFTGSGGAMPQNLEVPTDGIPVRKRPSITSIASSLLRFPPYNNSIAAVNTEDQDQYDEELVDLLDAVGM